MRSVRIAITAGILLVVAAACGGDDGTIIDYDPAPTTTPAGDLPALDDDPDAAFVVIDVEGVPAITADGRVFDRAPRPQGFAAAAAPLNDPVGTLVTAQLTPDGLRAVVAKAAALELLQTPPDYGEPGITDMGSLDVTLTTADGVYEHHVYAPNESTGDRSEDAARARLAEFVIYVRSLSIELGDDIGPWTPYVPDRWVVDTSPYVGVSDTEPWPFDTEPVDGCVAFPSDPDADTASGLYALASPGSEYDRVVEVSPALPFTEC